MHDSVRLGRLRQMPQTRPMYASSKKARTKRQHRRRRASSTKIFGRARKQRWTQDPGGEGDGNAVTGPAGSPTSGDAESDGLEDRDLAEEIRVDIPELGVSAAPPSADGGHACSLMPGDDEPAVPLALLSIRLACRPPRRLPCPVSETILGRVKGYDGLTSSRAFRARGTHRRGGHGRGVSGGTPRQ